MFEMYANGFEPVASGEMAIVHPLGNDMFSYINVERCIGPYKLITTTGGRWYDIAEQFGMKRKTIDSLCVRK